MTSHDLELWIGQYPGIQYPVRLLTRRRCALVFRSANGIKFAAYLRDGVVKTLEHRIRQAGGIIQLPQP